MLAGAILLSIHALRNHGRDNFRSGLKRSLHHRLAKKLFVKSFCPAFFKKRARSRARSPWRPPKTTKLPIKTPQNFQFFREEKQRRVGRSKRSSIAFYDLYREQRILGSLRRQILRSFYGRHPRDIFLSPRIPLPYRHQKSR